MNRLIDAIGQQHAVIDADQKPRILSLVPSVTELVCDLGLDPGWSVVPVLHSSAVAVG